MKTLFLVRHAKASRDDPALPDRGRPLSERGLLDAAAMASRLAAQHAKPDLIVSSPALRALTTARLFARALGHAPEDIVVDERLYAGSAGSLLEVVRGLDAGLAGVMLFGHNPAFSELAQRLAGAIDELPTCAVVELQFGTTNWRHLGEAAPTRVTLLTPKGQAPADPPRAAD